MASSFLTSAHGTFYCQWIYTPKIVTFLFFDGKNSKKIFLRGENLTDRAISPIISAGIAAQRGRNIVNIRLYAVKLDRPLSEAERSTLARFLPPERQDRIKTSEPLCAYALLCRALHELYGLEDLPTASTASRTLLRIRTFISA